MTVNSGYENKAYDGDNPVKVSKHPYPDVESIVAVNFSIHNY